MHGDRSVDFLRMGSFALEGINHTVFHSLWSLAESQGDCSLRFFYLRLGMVQPLIGLMSRWRNLYYRAWGVKLHGYVWLREIEIPRNFADIDIQPGCALDRGVTLVCSGKPSFQPKLCLGAHTYINRYTIIDAAVQITIGDRCAIGPGCYITDHDHGTHPGLPPLEQPLISQPTQIGDWVWLGANVTVLKGVTIGDRAVIGAGSVVTHNIPADAIAVGVPAHVIRYRHDDPNNAPNVSALSGDSHLPTSRSTPGNFKQNLSVQSPTGGSNCAHRRERSGGGVDVEATLIYQSHLDL